MSEDEPDRPLTRRERRLREQAAQESGNVPAGGASSESSRVETVPLVAAPPTAASSPSDSPSTETADEDDIVISPFREDGTPRTRREIRALREQALAARRPVQPPRDSEPPVEVSAPSESEAVDSRLVDTQPYTPEDLEAGVPEPPEEEFAHEEGLPEPPEEPEQPEAVEESEHSEPCEETEESESADETEPSSDYSFPDIVPLEENVSVFDDPARVQVDPHSDADSGGAGDFDDLISSAVAQEGSPHSTNTSALILPHLPDSGGLSGPLGETGELYVTGSIEMPRSIGETGGRAALQDAADLDPIDELGFDALRSTGDPIEPVPAKNAVSTTGAHTPIVANQAKEKSKLPLVLILTGGGLLVVIVGLVTWGATSGMFG